VSSNALFLVVSFLAVRVLTKINKRTRGALFRPVAPAKSSATERSTWHSTYLKVVRRSSVPMEAELQHDS
jgi:hypothetical protein